MPVHAGVALRYEPCLLLRPEGIAEYGVVASQRRTGPVLLRPKLENGFRYLSKSICKLNGRPGMVWGCVLVAAVRLSAGLWEEDVVVETTSAPPGGPPDFKANDQKDTLETREFKARSSGQASDGENITIEPLTLATTTMQ